MQKLVYRGYSVNESIDFDDRAELTQRFYGQNSIHITFLVPDIKDIKIGDWIVHNNVKYFVNVLPTIDKKATNQYYYTIEFEAEYYNLNKVQFLLSSKSDFNYIGDLNDFLDLIVSNMNRVFTRRSVGIWSKGTVDASNTEHRNLHFQIDNCRTALQKICVEFDCEI